MDARITKQRLSNLLSYDWLKALFSVAAVVVALILLFTMVAHRPTEAQNFTIYAYQNLSLGSAETKLTDDLEGKSVFSYDILKVNVETFTGNEYASTVLTARRAAGEGTVMFISSLDGKGEVSKESDMYALSTDSLYKGEGAGGGFYDPQYFLEQEVKNYLKLFFGESLDGQLDEAAAERRFLERNSSDPRFRSDEQKTAGIADEKKRLNKLLEDYRYIEAAFENGKLAYTAINRETGALSKIGFGEACAEGSEISAVHMGGLAGIGNLFYYKTSEGKATIDSVNLMLFYNSYGKDYDLRYETVSFLRYLTEKFGG